MFRLRNTNRTDRADDRGIAVVAAIGVAFILMVILTIVVALTVSTTNNSGRDRVRTASIHSAEGALDSTLAVMEHSVPCGAPPFSPLTVGSGAQQTIVTVTIEYYSDSNYSNVVGCSGGALLGVAKYAIVKATSVPAHAVNGVQPSRTIEAQLAVTSRGVTAKVPGLYAAKDMYLVGTPDFFSPNPDNSPDIWVDTGTLHCWPTINHQTEIEADVVVGQGNADLQEWCWFVKSVFVGGDMTWGPSNAAQTQDNNQRCNNKFICGDLTVRGKLWISNSGQKLTTGGDVTVGGTITPAPTGGTRLVADGSVTKGVSTIVAKTVQGFPSVHYDLSDWQDEYPTMVEAHIGDLQSRLVYKNGYSVNNVRNCNFNSQYYNSTISLTTTKTVYDLRNCDGVAATSVNDVMKFSSTNTIKVYADTAFIVSGFFNSGTLNFVSGNGAHHNVWIIVTDEAGEPAYNGYITCSSATLWSLCSTKILTTDSLTPIMWYTKHLFYSDGTDNAVNDMYGQVFAGSVYFKGYLDLQFETIPIPGAILWDAGDPGFDVQLLSKLELPTG